MFVRGRRVAHEKDFISKWCQTPAFILVRYPNYPGGHL